MTATAITWGKAANEPATWAQASFILTLLGTDKSDDNFAEGCLAVQESMTKKEASDKITELKAAKPAVTVAPHHPVAPIAAGAAKGEWHCLGGKFYRVAQSQSSGKLYAKVRDMDNGGFDYSPGIIGKLSAATRVTADNIDAIRAYAADHHACLFCGLPLDTPESTTAGYGPVCASKNGLPWGE